MTDDSISVFIMLDFEILIWYTSWLYGRAMVDGDGGLGAPVAKNERIIGLQDP